MPPKSTKSSAAPAAKPQVRRMAAAKPAAKKPAAKVAAKPASTKAAAPAAAAAAPPPPKRESMEIGLKQIKPVLITESDNAILKSGKAPLLCDPSTRALTFMRYGEDCVLIDAFDPSPLEAEKLRRSLLFAMRWGRTLVFNMEEHDLNGVLNDAFEKLSPGLWPKVQDRSIVKAENFKPLLRESDEQEFRSEYQFTDDHENGIDKFRCVVYTSSENPSDALKDNFYLVHVQ